MMTAPTAARSAIGDMCSYASSGSSRAMDDDDHVPLCGGGGEAAGQHIHGEYDGYMVQMMSMMMMSQSGGGGSGSCRNRPPASSGCRRRRRARRTTSGLPITTTSGQPGSSSTITTSRWCGAGAAGAGPGAGAGAGPCAACKLLRRKCRPGECVFAPYFPPEDPHKFASVHRVFGASNVSKLLLRLPPHQRADAVTTLAFEADARIQDPVYGCVAAISLLQRHLLHLQHQLALVYSRLHSAAAANNNNTMAAALLSTAVCSTVPTYGNYPQTGKVGSIDHDQPLLLSSTFSATASNEPLPAQQQYFNMSMAPNSTAPLPPHAPAALHPFRPAASPPPSGGNGGRLLHPRQQRPDSAYHPYSRPVKTGSISPTSRRGHDFLSSPCSNIRDQQLCRDTTIINAEAGLNLLMSCSAPPKSPQQLCSPYYPAGLASAEDVLEPEKELAIPSTIRSPRARPERLLSEKNQHQPVMGISCSGELTRLEKMMMMMCEAGQCETSVSFSSSGATGGGCSSSSSSNSSSSTSIHHFHPEQQQQQDLMQQQQQHILSATVQCTRLPTSNTRGPMATVIGLKDIDQGRDIYSGGSVKPNSYSNTTMSVSGKVTESEDHVRMNEVTCGSAGNCKAININDMHQQQVMMACNFHTSMAAAAAAASPLNLTDDPVINILNRSSYPAYHLNNSVV